MGPPPLASGKLSPQVGEAAIAGALRRETAAVGTLLRRACPGLGGPGSLSLAGASAVGEQESVRGVARLLSGRERTVRSLGGLGRGGGGRGTRQCPSREHSSLGSEKTLLQPGVPC